MDIDFTEAQNKLMEINTLVSQKCPELSLIINYSLSLNGTIAKYVKHKGNVLLLCLYYNNNCISSIEIQFNEYLKNPLAIVINSKTQEEYNNHKYNILLRSILIYISQFIKIKGKNINEIVSHGINDITIYIMIKYFKATYDDNFNELFIEYMKDKPLNINIIQKYFKENDPMHEGIMLFIDLTNIELMQYNFNNIINNYINNIMCITSAGKRYKKTKKQKYKKKTNKNIRRKQTKHKK